MELKMKTQRLQELVGKAVKGASDNKLIPLTSLLCIEVKSNKLTLITTDATNYLYIRDDKIGQEDFYVTVPADMFSKLISKMTCEEVVLSLEPNIQILKVKGNGDYVIELPLDENGSLIRFPDPLSELELSEETRVGTVHLSTIVQVLNTVKPALATTLEIPCYTGYYMGDKIVGTDTYKIASLNIKMFDNPKLISLDMVNLLGVMSNEEITIDMKGNVLVYSTPDCIVYGPVMEGLDEFAIDAISELVESEFESVCKLPRKALVNVLDRLSLFVTTYDKNEIHMVFTKEGLRVSSKASSSVEVIPYLESKNFKEFFGAVDIEMLASQVKAQVSDVVEIQYGLDNAIKMVDGNVTQIVALVDEEE